MNTNIKARTYVHKLKLKGKKEWPLYCKNRIKRLKPKPLEIPSSPNRKYKKFWKGWGDWLGTGNKRGGQPGNKNQSKR